MLISDHNDAFLYNFRPVQDYFSSYETGKSVTGGKEENPEKKRTCTPTSRTWFCVTLDCKTDQLGSNLRRRVHCLGVGSCQSDIAALKVVLIHFITCCVMLHQSLL